MAIENDILVRVLLRDREKLFAYCWAIVRDPHLAEEVFQEVSMLALQKRDSIADAQHLAGWLRHAARRKALEAVRDRRAKPTLLDNALLDLLEPEWQRWDDTPSATLLDALRDCVGRLGANARELIDLRYGQGLKSSRIAEKLHRKIETVYVALSRVHGKLAECVRLRQAAAARADGG
jgi:RNA polymerase sigma-70 factor, ECF subfamily